MALTLPLGFVTVAATLDHGWSSPSTPLRVSVASASSSHSRTTAVGCRRPCLLHRRSVRLGWVGGWDAPSKLRTRATSGPHSGHERPDRSGQHRPPSAYVSGHTSPPAAGRCDPHRLSDTEAVMGAAPGASLSRPPSTGDAGNQAVQATLGSVRAGSVPQRSSTGMGGH